MENFISCAVWHVKNKQSVTNVLIFSCDSFVKLFVEKLIKKDKVLSSA